MTKLFIGGATESETNTFLGDFQLRDESGRERERATASAVLPRPTALPPACHFLHTFLLPRFAPSSLATN